MEGISDAAVRVALKGQYHAALAMLREAVELCPDDLWLDETPRNAFWRVAYHALFFVHLYLMDTPEHFVPWSGHQAEVQQHCPMSMRWRPLLRVFFNRSVRSLRLAPTDPQAVVNGVSRCSSPDGGVAVRTRGSPGWPRRRAAKPSGGARSRDRARRT